MPKNVGDLGKLIVHKAFKKLPKVQKNRPIWSHWLPIALFGDQHYKTNFTFTYICTQKIWSNFETLISDLQTGSID